jgi:hypothetical protein
MFGLSYSGQWAHADVFGYIPNVGQYLFPVDIPTAFVDSVSSITGTSQTEDLGTDAMCFESTAKVDTEAFHLLDDAPSWEEDGKSVELTTKANGLMKGGIKFTLMTMKNGADSNKVRIFIKPKDSPFFPGMDADTRKTLYIAEGSKEVAKDDPSFNCFYHALGKQVGLQSSWIDAPEGEKLLKYFDPQARYTKLSAMTKVFDDSKDGDVLIFRKKAEADDPENPGKKRIVGGFMIHAVVINQDAKMVTGKVGEGPTAMTSVEAIYTFYSKKEGDLIGELYRLKK